MSNREDLTLLGVTHESRSFLSLSIPQIFCKSCAAFLKFTLHALKIESFGFYNGPYSGKEETVVFASSSKNAFLPGTALGSNTEGQ